MGVERARAKIATVRVPHGVGRKFESWRRWTFIEVLGTGLVQTEFFRANFERIVKETQDRRLYGE